MKNNRENVDGKVESMLRENTMPKEKEVSTRGCQHHQMAQKRLTTENKSMDLETETVIFEQVQYSS